MAIKKTFRVGMVGYKFMGKAHSNAWSQVGHFFDLPVKVELAALCGRDRAAAERVAANWGWQSVETDYRRLCARDDIDAIDIGTPNNTHAVMAIEAAKNGKAVICEKPLAMNVTEARRMTDAVKKARVPNMVWYNYRRVPAVALAEQLVREGRLGRIYHVRAVYLQDWIMDPAFPLVWRLDRRVAGSGAHGDLNAHIIDMARFITGSEIESVSGLAETFIRERPVGEMTGGLNAAGRGKRLGKVTVDDTVSFLARFAGGAVGTFEATRFAQGRKNGNAIEVNGEKGSLRFAFERMNELEFFDATRSKHLQGWTRILATEGGAHPYVGAWWPPGHIVGYEHTFVNQAADFVRGVVARKKLAPDFADASRTQAVLDAVLDSARKKHWVRVRSF